MRRLNIDPKAMWTDARNGLPISMPAMSMRQLLVVLVFATAVPLLTLAFVMYQQLIAHERQAIRDGLMSNARSLGALVEKEIDTHVAIAAALATSGALESGDLAAFRTQAERALLVVPGAWVNLSDAAGHLIMTTLPTVSLPTEPRAKTELDAMAQAFATGKPSVSDIAPRLPTGRSNAVIEFPVFKAGTPQYSLVVGLNPDRFQALTGNRFGPETQVGIIDRHYRFVARIPDPEGRLGTPASEGWQAAIARSRQGFADIVTLEGKPTLAAYVLTRDGWTAGLFVPNTVLEAPVRRILYSMGLLSLTMTLASLGFALGLGRRLSVVMSGLVTSAQRVGRGEIVEKESFPVHEATAISEALHATSEELTSRNAALRESEIRFRGTFENAAVGVAHVGLDGKFLMVNQRLCEILGYPREELQTRAFQDITHPDDLEADLENLGKLRAAEISSYTMDKRYVRKDGSIVWTGLTVSLQHDEIGSPDYFIKVVRDITERKAAQDHGQFLLRETAHRSKNQLAVVQSMMRQTAPNSTSLADFQQSFGSRIQGLAVSINMLVTENWTGAALGELVHRQLEAFGDGDARLECHGPKVTVSADAAQAIGLALHELATNSVKHGAWSDPAGVVSVSWLIESNGTEMPRLRLSWQERGGPVVTPPTRKGFGHMVIEHMVAQKLEATVEMAFASKGMCWTLAIPSTHFADGSGGGAISLMARQ